MWHEYLQPCKVTLEQYNLQNIWKKELWKYGNNDNN